MINKNFIFLTVVFVFQLLETNCQIGKKPNIIFVLADDLGYADINCFDSLHRQFYETPNIDKLAAQGIKFTQAYANAANCSPSRAALISGQYYPHQPIYHVGEPFEGRMKPAPNAHELPDSKFTIAEALKQGGYRTGFIGKWHIGQAPATVPMQQGFDINIGGYNAGNPGSWKGGYFQPNNNPYIDDAHAGEYLTDYLTRKAIDFIEAWQNDPFYLQLSYYTPHSPFQAPEELVQKYKQKKGIDGHDNPAYAAMIESLDSNVGLLMKKLEERGIADNTIFIFFSDNGGRGGYGFLGHEKSDITSNTPLKGGKSTFYEGGIRVPMIVRWPKMIEPGSECKIPVIGIDFFPTFIEIANLKEPDNYVLDGVSLVSLFKCDEVNFDPRPLYWHFPGYPNNPWRTGPVSVIREGPWKLMKFYESNSVELYNLDMDEKEQQDMSERLPEIRQKLQRHLEVWLEQNHAPMPTKRR